MDLEKNARIYAGIPEDSPQDLKNCVMDKKAKYDAFIAGANWQKQLIENRAIWCEAHPEDEEIWGCFDIYNLRDGEKVKVIVIKED